MRIGGRIGLAVGSATLAALLCGGLTSAQDTPAAKGANGGPLPKRKTDPSRRVPAYFGQIGLTPEQRTSIYALQAKHQEKIEALEKQIEAEKATMISGCEAVLTETQKKLLSNLRQAAAEGTSRPATAPAPGSAPAPKG